jgi:hypothetical protein
MIIEREREDCRNVMLKSKRLDIRRSGHDISEKVFIDIPVKFWFCFAQNHGRKEMQRKLQIRNSSRKQRDKWGYLFQESLC